MPIYLEARNVSDLGGAAGGHMYLVYVPLGEEGNYSAWKTIGAYPGTDSATGPWGVLNGEFLGGKLYGSGSRDEYGAFLESCTQAELDAMDPDVLLHLPTLAEVTEARGRQLIYSGADEASKWAGLVGAATDLGDRYSYKSFTLTGNVHHICEAA